MENCWDRVMKLTGTMLYTTRDNKPFEILEVQSDRIKFVPKEGTGTDRYFLRKSLESICGSELNLEAIRPGQIKKMIPTTRNESYAAAIIRKIAQE